MKKIWKIRIREIISISLLIIDGGTFIVLLPKFFVTLAVNIIESLGGLPTENQKDENGNIIHQDWRKTIQSFGSRRQSVVEKRGATEISWFLFDRDKNKDIDKINRYTLSP